MQVDTFNPGLIIGIYSHERWWLRRDDDGVMRYHQWPDDAGKMPSEFYSHSGTLSMEFKAA